MILSKTFWSAASLSDILKLTQGVKNASMNSADFTTTQAALSFQDYATSLTGIKFAADSYSEEQILSSFIETPSNVVEAITLRDLNNVTYSTDTNLNALLDTGVNLNFLTPAREIIYYSFDLQNVSDSGIYTPLSPFNATQKQAARSLLNYANSVTGVVFQEVALGQNADVHFANTDLYDPRVTALTNKYSNYQYNSQTGEIVNYSVNIYVYLDNVESKNDNAAPISGTKGYENLLHEIGHTLGLKHPFETPYTLSTTQDNTENTVMSYTQKGEYKTQFQELDLAALNWIYGGDGLGGKSSSSVTLAKTQQGTVADDYLEGTPKADKITGLAGNDTLNGGAGRDTLIGGDGNDIYLVDNAFDKIVEEKEAGIDSMQSTVNYTLPKNVENLLLTDSAKTGIGNELSNKLRGNDLANSLNAKAGDDTIEGGKGNDTLTGGTGNDAFVFNINDYDFLGDFAPRAQNIDTIIDFKKGEDTIELSAAFGFKGFAIAKSLKTFSGEESLIYDLAAKTLYFDADGAQTRYAPTAFIKFTGKVVLEAADLQFINDTSL